VSTKIFGAQVPECSDITPLEQRLTYRFGLIVTRMGHSLAQHHERWGLSVSSWRVMGVIGRYEPLSAKELAERTSLNPFRVTRALTVLSDKGFVSRKIDPQDRRRASLRLTRSGREVHDEIAARLSKMERLMLRDLSEHEQVVLHQLLDRLDARIADFPVSGVRNNLS